MITGDMTIFTGSTFTVDASSAALILGNLTDTGTLTTSGALIATGQVSGGSINVAGGVTDLGGLVNEAVNLSGAQTVLRVRSLTGSNAVHGMTFGESVDLAGITNASLSGDTVTVGASTIQLDAAPAGYVYGIYGDAHGGEQVLLTPTFNDPSNFSFTDVTTQTSGQAAGQDYRSANGSPPPVDYLQRQYIDAESSNDKLAIRANVPNAFIKGGLNSDALMADFGSNVLDGGAGSNFLIGGNGADGGIDTFFVDARDPSTITWDTIVGFHHGDQATIFGFTSASTLPLTASDGAAGFTGVTIHSEVDGAGTGVTASMTFAGIDLATAQQHFVYSTGVLPGNVGYLLIQYN
jgi:hypothetical protein